MSDHQTGQGREGGYGIERRVPSAVGTRISWALGAAVMTLLAVGIVSPYALICVLFDGGAAMVVLAPGALAGLWLIPLFRLGSMPLRWHVLLGAALGLGCLCLLVLFLGMASCLHRPVWLVLLGLFAVLGVVRLRSLPVVDEPAARPGYPWLLVVPFLVLALLAASNAPGLIWQEEGNGYDVLEYHLEMPKEYLNAGNIHHAPHNVYANFPANVEMLYLLAMIVLDEDVEAGLTANMIHLLLAALTVYAAWVAGRDWSPRAGCICAITMATAGWLAYLSGLAYVENGVLFFGMTATGALLRIARTEKEGAPTEASVLSRRQLGWVIVSGVLAGFAAGCKYTALPMVVAPLITAAVVMSGRTKVRIIRGLALGAAALAALMPWLVKNQVMTGNPVFPLMNRVFEASPPGWGPESTARWERGHTPPIRERSISAIVGSFWGHVLWDQYHRFGPAVFLLAVGGLFRRRREPADWALGIMALIQTGVWLLATHLYARFAVVLLIPLALLAGRSVGRSTSAVRWHLVIGLLTLGTAWNFAHVAKLHRTEAAYGVTGRVFYDGLLPGYEYLRTVNHELPADAKVLLVGDARAFYIRPAVDYHVVFNVNPFAKAVRAARNEQELLAWLQGRGYTHVLVHWAEIGRLAATYGFAPEVNPTLFDRLRARGLRLVRAFPHPAGKERYVELYEVPPYDLGAHGRPTDNSSAPHRDRRIP